MRNKKSQLDLRVRPIKETDNNQLIQLARSIGVPARVKLGVDRSPTFWAFSKMQGKAWDILVAEHNDGIVGFIDMSHRKFRLGEAVKQVTYVGLAGVRAGWRGTLVFPKLLRASEKLARKHGSECAIALVNVNNTRLSKSLRYIFRNSRRCVDLRVSCILLGPRYRYNGILYIENATHEDQQTIVDLIVRYYGRYQFAPLLDKNNFVRLVNTHLLDFLVVRDKRKKIVATMGLWDQGCLRKIVVLDYEPRMVWLRRLINSSRYFTRIKRMPDPGGYFEYLYSIFAACEEGFENSLCELLRFACNKYSQHNYHFLIMVLPESSRILQMCSDLWSISNNNIPIVIPLTNDMATYLNDLGSCTLYLEYALS